MATPSPEFEQLMVYTVEKTIEHREPELPEIDPELAAEVGWQPTRTRYPLGEFGSISGTKVFCGFIDEGGYPRELTLSDGSTVEFRQAGHLNISRSIGTNSWSMTRHILDYSGVVYRREKEQTGFEPITDEQITSLLEDLHQIDQ